MNAPRRSEMLKHRLNPDYHRTEPSPLMTTTSEAPWTDRSNRQFSLPRETSNRPSEAVNPLLGSAWNGPESKCKTFIWVILDTWHVATMPGHTNIVRNSEMHRKCSNWRKRFGGTVFKERGLEETNLKEVESGETGFGRRCLTSLDFCW